MAQSTETADRASLTTEMRAEIRLAAIDYGDSWVSLAEVALSRGRILALLDALDEAETDTAACRRDYEDLMRRYRAEVSR